MEILNEIYQRVPFFMVGLALAWFVYRIVELWNQH